MEKMSIETQEDWIELAKKTIPLLPDYLNEFGSIKYVVLDELFARFLADENWDELHNLFEQMWQWLPDSPSIRHRPFFDLCDLCSEYKVWEQPPLDI